MGNVLADTSGTPSVLVDPDLVKVLAQPEECPCALPDTPCPHAICFSFNIATADLSGGYYDAGYQVKMLLSGGDVVTAFAYIQDDGMGGYKAGYFFDGVTIEVPMALADFFDHWHHITAKYISDEIRWEVCAYGVTGTAINDRGNVDQLFVGSSSAFPGPVDVQIKDIKFLGNPGAGEPDFIFPTDSFDSTIGSGQSISGDTVHVVCSDSADNGYLASLSPEWLFHCPCSCCGVYLGLSVDGGDIGMFAGECCQGQSFSEGDHSVQIYFSSDPSIYTEATSPCDMTIYYTDEGGSFHRGSVSVLTGDVSVGPISVSNGILGVCCTEGFVDCCVSVHISIKVTLPDSGTICWDISDCNFTGSGSTTDWTVQLQYAHVCGEGLFLYTLTSAGNTYILGPNLRPILNEGFDIPIDGTGQGMHVQISYSGSLC